MQVRIVATGSSTLEATAKFRDSLSGRKEEVWLTPMIEADRASAGGGLDHRLARGGLPGFYLEGGSERDVQEWLDSYWAKDIQELFRLGRRSSFARFVELVLARSGGLFEATAFAGPAEVSRTTVANYLAVLEITKVAIVVRPFSTRRASELVHAPKVYGFDTGFVRTLRGWGELREDDLEPRATVHARAASGPRGADARRGVRWSTGDGSAGGWDPATEPRSPRPRLAPPGAARKARRRPDTSRRPPAGTPGSRTPPRSSRTAR